MLKPVLKLFLSLYVFLYRRTNGGFGGAMQGLKVLLLTTTGRKTGKERITPLGYFEDGDAYIIIASNAGAERHPAWFFNLKSNPNVTIEIKNRRLAAVAEPANPEERTRLWARLIELSPNYDKYQKRISREIPMVILRTTQS